MKLVILGANGRTGAHVVREALEDGADVTAVVRSPDKRPRHRHARLKVVIGDPSDAEFLVGVLRGQDAVISTLGGRRPTKRAASVYYTSAAAMVEAAHRAGVKRLVVTSTALLFPPRRLVDRVLAVMVHNVVQSATRMERILRAPDLEVGVARCGFLTDGGESRYRASRDALPKNGSSISRRSLARFLLDCANGKWAGPGVYGVSSPAT